MNVMKNKLTREICITGVENGYIISVGCKKFVITTIDDLLLELREYLHNPKRRESELFPDILADAQPAQVFQGLGGMPKMEMGDRCAADQ